jgi:predicted GNAT superfamily acetyltransferase
MISRPAKKKGSRLGSPKSQTPQGEVENGILIRHCHGLDEFQAAMEVERAVWMSEDIDVVPVPLFVVASETGGQVLGAFEGNKIVGFTLALAGWRDRKPLLHSHMTAVLESHRDCGIGQRLKLFQREDALARGIALIEWTFDPLIMRNAHLNLMRLGAIARRYLPNAYGATTSPLHAVLPTDRLVAEWHLHSPRVDRILSGKRAARPLAKKAVHITVPAEIDDLKKKDPAVAARIQIAIREEFQYQFGKGFAAVAIAPGPAGMDYTLEPWKKS